MTNRTPGTIICLSQVYVPDPASVGQHMADAAEALAHRGYRVIVYTSRRGYDDPSQRFPSRESRNGVLIRRIPFSSFGKGRLITRILGQLAFLAQSMIRGVFVRRPVGLLVTTSPPMTPVAALIISALRRIPIMFWVMDINPDQAIAMGEVSSNSTAARLLDWANRRLLNRAAAVITLDRFMANSLEQKARMGARLRVLPPWPHQQYVQGINHSNNPFRSAHNLDERFVVLYSGNHSPAHPLETLIEAARMLEGRPDVAFLFVGGGLGKEPVEAAIRNDRLVDTISLPYQPLAQIRYSLSAGDVHVVSMGDQMVGCVHPSKVYAAMAVGRPIVLLGPPDCHVGDLIREHGIGWQIDHGDVKGLVSLLLRLGDHPEEVAAAGLRAKAAVDGAFSRKRLMTAFTDLVAGAFD